MGSEKIYLTVDNCNASDFNFLCPTHWGALKLTEEENVRFCTTCRRNVYLCATDEQLQRHVARGDCIAKNNTEKVVAQLAEHQRLVDEFKKSLNQPLVGYIRPPKVLPTDK